MEQTTTSEPREHLPHVRIKLTVNAKNEYQWEASVLLGLTLWDDAGAALQTAREALDANDAAMRARYRPVPTPTGDTERPLTRPRLANLD